MARRIESVAIAGPAGTLEALLEEPEHAAPSRVALVCHPHPLYGGTMHNKVVHRLGRGLRRSGAVALRFNFRGVGRSQGTHGNLEGEIDDARAALAWLRARYPELPCVLAGFSFGSRVITRLGCELGVVERLIAAGFPTRFGATQYLETCAVPKFFLQSARDEHGPRPELERLYATFAGPKHLVWIDAADHFFAGALDEHERRVIEAATAGTD